MKTLTVLFFGLVTSMSAFASTSQELASEFKKAQAADKTIVLAFHSKSCGTCRAQKPALQSALEDSAFNTVQALMLNYEDTAELRKELNVKTPSTVVVFKGTQEKGRSIGMTDASELKTLISRGV